MTTDEGLARQLATTSAIHDAIFAKTTDRPAIAGVSEPDEETTDLIFHDCPNCGGHEQGETK